MDAFIVNCKPNHWEICNKYTIFGIKETNALPPLTKGDLILFRISGSNYGLQALWYFDYAKRVVNQNNLLLSDDDYAWIINCKKILTLTQRFSEEFQTSSKKSSKITDLYAGGIQKQVVAIKKPQIRDYIFHIIKEYQNELNINITYLGDEVNVNELLQNILDQLVAVAPFPESDKNEIIETILNPKEKTEKQISEQQEKLDKPDVQPKKEPEKHVLDQKEKTEKQISEQQENLDKPVSESKKEPEKTVLDQKEGLEKQISEQQEKLEKPVSESKKEPEKTVLDQKEGPEKQISERQENLDKPVSESKKEIEKSVLVQKEKSDELISERTENIDKNEFELEEMVDESISEQEEDFDELDIKSTTKISHQRLNEKVGERINLPILNYAPLNKKGVILLFGHYMQKLGISHVEEIKTGFPDAIAIRSDGNGNYQRVRIGFEFKSSSFLEKDQKVSECELIVCWKHDWNSCPIEVIELCKVLFKS